MNLIDVLLGEHGPLRHQLDALRLAAPRLGEAELRAATLGLAEAIESHAALEDELLFIPLIQSGQMPPGPVEAMRAEHRRIEHLLGQILAPAADPEGPDPQRTVALLVETVRHHFDHEEHVLFAIARNVLTPENLSVLANVWANRRGVEVRLPKAPQRGQPAAVELSGTFSHT